MTRNILPLTVPRCWFGRMVITTCFACCLVVTGCQESPTPIASSDLASSDPQASEVGPELSDIAESPMASESTQEPVRIAGQPSVESRSIQLRKMPWKDVEALVTEHKGKVVVIDIWSTSCEPCLRELPHLVTLQKTYGDKVVGISFDCDFIGAKNKPVDYYRERVVTALKEIHADNLINAMSTTPADELFQEIKLDSIPAVYVFDQSGKLAKRFDNNTPAGGDEEGISYEKQISPMVAELVKAANP